jgi:hypothetical protein
VGGGVRRIRSADRGLGDGRLSAAERHPRLTGSSACGPGPCPVGRRAHTVFMSGVAP